MKKIAIIFNANMMWILAALLALCTQSFSAPSLEIPKIDKQAQELFKIERIKLKSNFNKERSYYLYIALPKAALEAVKQDPKSLARENGVYYTLDGNGFFPRLLNFIAADSSLNNTRTLESMPIFVSIGHDSELAYDRALRTYDYLPNIDTKLDKDLQDTFQGSGGVEAFLDFITKQVQPFIHKKFDKPRKELLLGHSFGGMFVLYTLLTKPNSFSHYVCASPSLWWGEGRFVARGIKNLKPHSLNVQIDFTRGALENPANQKNAQTSPKSTPKQANPTNTESKKSAQPAQAQRMPRKSIINIESIVSAFQNAALDSKNVRFTEFAGQSHGSSVPYAMELGLKNFMRE